MNRIYGIVVALALLTCAGCSDASPGVSNAPAPEAKAQPAKAKPTAMVKTEAKPKAEAEAAKKPSPPTKPAPKPEPEPLDMGKASYGIGLSVGGGIRSQGLDELDVDAFIEGFRSGLSDAKSKYTEEEIKETMMALRVEMMKRQQEKARIEAETNRKAEADFLAANGKREGVTTLPSGLQYEVITAGAGASPKDTDKVTVHYRGSLLDGTEFDSSYKREQPASFPVKGVIPGWTEGLKLMKPGGKWKLYIPSKLAYGPRGRRPTIGSDAMLVFEVELIEVNAPEPRPVRKSAPPKRPAKKLDTPISKPKTPAADEKPAADKKPADK